MPPGYARDCFRMEDIMREAGGQQLLAVDTRLLPGGRAVVRLAGELDVTSCGQPRDYDPRSCFGIWDDQSRVVEFHRVPYNAERTARKILEAGLSPHFARRLLHGV